MPPNPGNYSLFNKINKVWVLVPSLVSSDSTIDYYYDFTQSILEYTNTFKELGLEWQWQPVTRYDYVTIIDAIASSSDTTDCFPLILNLCDGDEINETPGISVIKYLHEKGLIFTGANELFYSLTTSKIVMKDAFDKANIKTPLWKVIGNIATENNKLLEELGNPLIVKPAISGGSMGIGIKNVVSDVTSMQNLIQELNNGYKGWNLTSGGLIAEQFVKGPEFTCLIVGSFEDKESAIIYTPVERVFHASLPENERFLSFDRLWEIYEEESPMPEEDHFYEYALPQHSIIQLIQQLSWDAYCAVKGIGYARVDLRMNSQNGELFVLEVNAQCGISEDEDYTSIGAILKFSNASFTGLVAAIIKEAILRKV